MAVPILTQTHPRKELMLGIILNFINRRYNKLWNQEIVIMYVCLHCIHYIQQL